MKFDELINNRLWGFDFEVTKYDWLLILIKYSDKTKVTFHNDCADDIFKFIEKYDPILIGHNARYYDQYILKGILSGFSVEEVKEINNHIINGGQGFELQYDYVQLPPIWDTIQDVVPPKSLKEIEACLLMDITESTVSFDIDHPWNEREYDEMLYYCTKDVEALFPLFEARKGYFKTKYDLCVLSGIDPAYNMGLTNAKLCAKFLEAKKVDRDDEREYTIPSTIDINYVPKEILKFFERVHDKTISDEELFTSKLEFDFHGMPSVFASGGAHGALPNYRYDEKLNPNIVVINVDYSSLYPHLLALPEYNFISRNIKDKNKYYDTLQRRLQLKHEGKKEEQLPLKLILNTTYGCQNNKYNDLYDPKGARNTCWTGQLLLASMTEEVFQIGGVKLIQINTDGLMVELPREKLPEYYEVCNKFSERVKIGVEYDIIHKIIQRDVNNYIMVYGEEGHLSIKAKGGCFASLPKLTIEEDGSVSSKYKPDFKANSLAIVSEALAKYLLFDTPIEETILNDDMIHKYQIVSHLGSTYEKCVQESPNGDILLQKNNRIYAGLIPSGVIVKVKPSGRRDKLANQPPNPIIDNGNKCTIDQINKQWYIKLATQWANDFLGIKRLTEYKKDELLTMAKDLGLEVDKKTKKDELIKMIEERNEVMKMATKKVETNEETKRGSQFIDISGNRYGHMIVLGLDHIDKFNKSYWKCRCDCGNEFVRSKSRIRISPINACGKCNYTKLEKRYTITHGDSPKEAKYHRLYNIWCSMKKRCYYPRHTHYNRYGGRGITICDEWLGTNGYATFKEWALSHGYKSNLTIERKDVDGNYCPENCCWIPLSEQSKNTSKVIKIPCYGRIYSLHEFCKTFHTSYFTVKKYIINGNMRPEDFLESRKIK